jgi:hypothetical protein
MILKVEKSLARLWILAVSGNRVFACPECRSQVREQVFNANFLPTLSVVLLPVAVILVIGLGLFYAGEIKGGVRQ